MGAWLAGWRAGLLVSWLVGWLACWLVGWLANWLVGCMAGWLVNYKMDLGTSQSRTRNLGSSVPRMNCCGPGRPEGKTSHRKTQAPLGHEQVTGKLTLRFVMDDLYWSRECDPGVGGSRPGRQSVIDRLVTLQFVMDSLFGDLGAGRKHSSRPGSLGTPTWVNCSLRGCKYKVPEQQRLRPGGVVRLLTNGTPITWLLE